MFGAVAFRIVLGVTIILCVSVRFGFLLLHLLSSFLAHMQAGILLKYLGSCPRALALAPGLASPGWWDHLEGVSVSGRYPSFTLSLIYDKVGKQTFKREKLCKVEFTDKLK